VNEASKTMLYYSGLLDPIFEGRSILDIGAGKDPIKQDARIFDLEEGNAEDVSLYGLGKFGCVFSSHCLEHMTDPVKALKSWWDLVETNGYLVVIVPEENLYEQGNFPSIFNGDHKATFRLGIEKSWSTNSFEVIELISHLENATVKYCKVQNDGYSYFDQNFRFKLKGFRKTLRRVNWRIYLQVEKIMFQFRLWPVDQTAKPDQRLAQIMFILQKYSS
jgi:SAM-dependent methyltransferase